MCEQETTHKRGNVMKWKNWMKILVELFLGSKQHNEIDYEQRSKMRNHLDNSYERAYFIWMCNGGFN